MSARSPSAASVLSLHSISVGLLLLALLLSLSCLLGHKYVFTAETYQQAISDPQHRSQLQPYVSHLFQRTFHSPHAFIALWNQAVDDHNQSMQQLGKGHLRIATDYTLPLLHHALTGWVVDFSRWLFPIIAALLVSGLVLYFLANYRTTTPSQRHQGQFQNSLTNRGILAWIAGSLLIVFYIVLYFFPHWLVPWLKLVNPVSRALNGHDASQWFLYGFLYTVAVWAMGIRMLARYADNRYMRLRTLSVMGFQFVFAFFIPELLVRLNYPWYDFKNIWPLNYTFFYEYQLAHFASAGFMGDVMLYWGIALIVVAVPVCTYFWGKRWYCSWVCGCGGLAETLGDPFRPLSDKRLVAWNVERWLVHAVLVVIVLLTIVTLLNIQMRYELLGQLTAIFQKGYGFLIGSVFAGVVGTGFYPLMGNRVWCRFGCPLAAYLGLIQRFKSRFRITTNGGHCISCGQCSTYCEMGIDVRWYAQRGQPVVRASCVGCGICASVCPRGVLRLENRSEKGRLHYTPAEDS